jgi:hypothetical protein
MAHIGTVEEGAAGGHDVYNVYQQESCSQGCKDNEGFCDERERPRFLPALPLEPTLISQAYQDACPTT